MDAPLKARPEEGDIWERDGCAWRVVDVNGPWFDMRRVSGSRCLPFQTWDIGTFASAILIRKMGPNRFLQAISEMEVVGLRDNKVAAEQDEELNFFRSLRRLAPMIDASELTAAEAIRLVADKKVPWAR